MSDVVHRARKGQGSDPSAARALLSQFVNAAYELSAGWDHALDGGYPRHLPSFDEFVAELDIWQESVKERQEVEEDEDIRPVNFAAPVEVRAWLKQVRGQVEDAVAAGEDATRPLGKRGLGRLMARRMVMEARRSLLELLQAAERGVS